MYTVKCQIGKPGKPNSFSEPVDASWNTRENFLWYLDMMSGNNRNVAREFVENGSVTFDVPRMDNEEYKRTTLSLRYFIDGDDDAV